MAPDGAAVSWNGGIARYLIAVVDRDELRAQIPKRHEHPRNRGERRANRRHKRATRNLACRARGAVVAEIGVDSADEALMSLLLRSAVVVLLEADSAAAWGELRARGFVTGSLQIPRDA